MDPLKSSLIIHPAGFFLLTTLLLEIHFLGLNYNHSLLFLGPYCNLNSAISMLQALFLPQQFTFPRNLDFT